MACIGAHHFSHQPELSMRYTAASSRWASTVPDLEQHRIVLLFSSRDMALNWRKALEMASDEGAECGHIGHRGGHGDHGLAYQSFKVAAAVNPSAEALNNLAVLGFDATEMSGVAKAAPLAHARGLEAATDAGPHLFEPAYNRALLALRHDGHFQESHEFATKSKELYPANPDTTALLEKLAGLLKAE